jgi:hypothetical protein
LKFSSAIIGKKEEAREMRETRRTDKKRSEKMEKQAFRLELSPVEHEEDNDEETGFEHGEER